MLSTAWEVQDNLEKMLMLTTLPIPHSTLRSPSSVSSLAPSPTPLASDSRSRSVVLDTVSTSARIYAGTTRKTSAILSSLACCWDAAQGFFGPPKGRL